MTSVVRDAADKRRERRCREADRDLGDEPVEAIGTTGADFGSRQRLTRRVVVNRGCCGRMRLGRLEQVARERGWDLDDRRLGEDLQETRSACLTSGTTSRPKVITSSSSGQPDMMNWLTPIRLY